MRVILPGLVALGLLSAAVSPAGDTPSEEHVREVLRQRMANPSLLALLAPADVQRFYKARDHRPAWTASGVPASAVGEALSAVYRGFHHGLDPRLYRPERIRALLELAETASDPEQLAALDLYLTDALLALAAHLYGGRLDRAAADAGWSMRMQSVDLPSRLLAALTVGAFTTNWVESLAPPHPGYHALRAELSAYRALAAKGGWAPVPPGPPLAFDSSGPRVARLSARLAVTGDLPEPEGDRFDEHVDAAVRRFQERHGLPADGVVGPRTIAALSMPVEDRIAQIIINLERWRWLPRTLGNPHILVNVPAYTVSVLEEGLALFTMRAVVGIPSWPTPFLSTALRGIELHPFWDVPRRLGIKDVLPIARRSPAALAALGISVSESTAVGWRPVESDQVPWTKLTDSAATAYRFRQAPGPANPLGQIKFVMPNRYEVLLHDTPARHFFDRTERLASHGCVRVEDAPGLAAYLLGISRDSVESMLTAREPAPHVITLSRSVPVHLVYHTAWVDERGMLQFRSDPYRWDARLLRALGGFAYGSSSPDGL